MECATIHRGFHEFLEWLQVPVAGGIRPLVRKEVEGDASDLAECFVAAERPRDGGSARHETLTGRPLSSLNVTAKAALFGNPLLRRLLVRELDADRPPTIRKRLIANDARPVECRPPVVIDEHAAFVALCASRPRFVVAVTFYADQAVQIAELPREYVIKGRERLVARAA
jgi:hypothetical protein